MTTSEEANASLIRAYLASLAANEPASALSRFFNADAIQVEFPNKLNPVGRRSDLPTIRRRMELGKTILARQTYSLRAMVAQGDAVAVEAEWTGVLATPVAGLEAGATMKAWFAMFFEFREGRIQVQRNYDCFEAW